MRHSLMIIDTLDIWHDSYHKPNGLTLDSLFDSYLAGCSPTYAVCFRESFFTSFLSSFFLYHSGVVITQIYGIINNDRGKKEEAS